jgi:AcrR family transcriptional regulator
MTFGSQPRKRDPDGTRQRLLRAALEMYGTDGFLATTTPELARRAGIAEGTIYRHFPSKEALLNSVYQGAQGWALKLIRDLDADRSLTPRERLMRVGRGMISAASHDPALVRLYLNPPEGRFLDDRSRAAVAETAAALQQLVAMGKSDGLVRPGPAELWAGVWVRVAGYAAERVATGEWSAEHPQIDSVLEAAWFTIASR